MKKFIGFFQSAIYAHAFYTHYNRYIDFIPEDSESGLPFELIGTLPDFKDVL